MQTIINFLRGLVMQKPAADLAQQQYEDALRSYLEAKAAAEYYEFMARYYEQTANRLRNYEPQEARPAATRRATA